MLLQNLYFDIWRASTHLGWGLLSQFPPFRYFLRCSSLLKHTIAIEYHVYIWQMSSQLSCGGTCQIWTWFEERYFCQIENFACGEINERSFSNPHPSWLRYLCWITMFGYKTIWATYGHGSALIEEYNVFFSMGTLVRKLYPLSPVIHPSTYFSCFGMVSKVTFIL